MDKYFINRINEERILIQNFLKPKKSKYKKDTDILSFFNNYFFNPTGNNYHLEDNKIEICYNKNFILKPIKIILYLPLNDSTILLPIDSAKKINIIKPYYDTKYKEVPITFKYYNSKLKCICNGPDIIISSLPLETIFIKDVENNEKLLSELF